MWMLYDIDVTVARRILSVAWFISDISWMLKRVKRISCLEDSEVMAASGIPHLRVSSTD